MWRPKPTPLYRLADGFQHENSKLREEWVNTVIRAGVDSLCSILAVFLASLMLVTSAGMKVFSWFIPRQFGTQSVSSLLLSRKYIKCVRVDSESNPTCSICLSEQWSTDHCLQLPCGHIFHSGCVDPWLLSRGNCPMCRHHVLQTPPSSASISWTWYWKEKCLCARYFLLRADPDVTFLLCHVDFVLSHPSICSHSSIFLPLS